MKVTRWREWPRLKKTLSFSFPRSYRLLFSLFYCFFSKLLFIFIAPSSLQNPRKFFPYNHFDHIFIVVSFVQILLKWLLSLFHVRRFRLRSLLHRRRARNCSSLLPSPDPNVDCFCHRSPLNSR